MGARKKYKKQSKLARQFRKWHRRLGVVAALFIIFLSLSGIALNHTDTFKLAKQPIKSSLLLDHYGINAPSEVKFYQAGNVWTIDNSLWQSGVKIADFDLPIISVLTIDNILYVVTQNELALYSEKFELIDLLDESAGLPIAVKHLALYNKNLVLITDTGNYYSDDDFFSWQPVDSHKSIQIITPISGTQAQLENAILQYRAQYLTLERIMLDAHSGRFFGQLGVLFMDFVALLMVILSISGIYIWAKQRRKI